MKKQLFLLLTNILVYIINAQVNLKYCGADEMRINTLKKNPKVAQAVIKRDIVLDTFTKQFVSDFYSKRHLQ